MSSTSTRRRRVLFGSVGPLLASVFFAGCSAGTEGPVGTTSEAVSGARGGVFNSGISKDNWHGVVGNGSRGEFDDGRGCRPAPLDLCPLFDTAAIGVDAGPACAHVTTDACPDRVDTWDTEILFGFVGPISSGCQFGQWSEGLLTAADVATYLNDLLSFTLQFFGCPLEPVEGGTGRLTYGLIPAALAGDRFTTADLDVLSQTYLAAVQQMLAENGAPPLTDDQAALVAAKLHRLARRVPHTVVSRELNFSTCAPDAAAPAADTSPDDDDCF